jgi:hypothetical protein
MRCAVSPKFRAFGLNLKAFQAYGGHLLALHTHSSPCTQQMASRHPHLTQRKQRHQLRRVFGQPFAANLGKTELALSHPERVLNLRANDGFELLRILQQATARRVLIQCPAFAGAHGDMPVHALVELDPANSVASTTVPVLSFKPLANNVTLIVASNSFKVGRPPFPPVPVGAKGWIKPTSSCHGTTKLISARNTLLLVRLVTSSNPVVAMLLCFIFVQRLSGRHRCQHFSEVPSGHLTAL